jgi:selenocysteine lyase/cysteine desulfurase
MGTGGLIVGERVKVHELSSLRQGGTGSRSEREEQPDFMPDCYESGTSNAVGLAGLLAGLTWLSEVGVEKIKVDEEVLCQRLIDGLMEIPGVTVYGTHDARKQTATIAWNMEGVEASTVGMRLDEEFGILCRVGLHCAPSAHRTIGTFPDGCVRFGLGAFTEESDVDRALQSVAKIAGENL